MKNDEKLFLQQLLKRLSEPTKFTIEKANEFINKHKNQVNPRWYPVYHIAAPCGWINDPNGFSFFKGEYHLFYQHYPYKSQWGPMHWGHVSSKDLIHWKHLPIALAPDQYYDIGTSGGCFSGSAIEKDDKLYLIYTAHYSDDYERRETQALAYSSDGINFEKFEGNPIIELPEAVDFRDPKVWLHDGKYYLIVGSKTTRKPYLGEVMLFESDDLIDWNYKGIAAKSEQSQDGLMWECPNFAEVDGNEVLIVSPICADNYNEYYHQVLYTIGKMDYEAGKFNHDEFGLLDYGLDFYAPQIIQAPDGRCLMIAWMDNWDIDIVEKKSGDGWACMMTVPRELHINDGKIISQPVKELENLRISERTYLNLNIDKRTQLDGIHGSVGELLMIIDTEISQTFAIGLRCSDDEETLLIYDHTNGIFEVNRDNSGRGSGGYCSVEVIPSDKLKLQIFIDKSSVEVFLNDGEAVLSVRIYPKESSEDIIFVPSEVLQFDQVSFFELDQGIQ